MTDVSTFSLLLACRSAHVRLSKETRVHLTQICHATFDSYGTLPLLSFLQVAAVAGAEWLFQCDVRNSLMPPPGVSVTEVASLGRWTAMHGRARETLGYGVAVLHFFSVRRAELSLSP